MRRACAALALLALSVPSIAQEQVDAATGRPLKFKERTDIDFEAVDVQGEIVKPMGVTLHEVAAMRFNPLLRLRESFVAELHQSVDEVK